MDVLDGRTDIHDGSANVRFSISVVQYDNVLILKTNVVMVKRLNLREQVVNELGQRIVQGGLLPGETLPKEADLSEEYGVSRTVVREAVKGLAARGLVQSRARVGTTVCARDAWKLLDPDVLTWLFSSDQQAEALRHLTEVRLVVEPAAAAWAAQRATEEEIDYIKACFRQLEAAVGDRDAWIKADVQLHDSILMACHNDLIEHLVRTLRSVLFRSREATILVMEQADPEDSEDPYEVATRQALELHRVPFEAIVAGDGPAARDGMRAILEWVMGVMHRFLEGHETTARQDGP